MTSLHLDHIPAELRSRPQWVTWKYSRHGRKLPCSVATGDVADAHDPASWGTIDAATRSSTRRKHAGIGFDFTPDDPYTGIDLDKSIDENGTLKPVAAAIVATMDTYTEISPSGKGVKLWVRGEIPASVTPTDIGDGVKIEMYSTGRFFTVTGNRYPGTPTTIRDVGPKLATLYEQVKPPPAPPTEQKPLPLIAANATHIRRWCLAALEGEQRKMQDAGEGERHNRRLASARALGGLVHTGGLTDQEIFDALAINFGKDRRGAELTIWDGIAAGEEKPRSIPEPKQPTFDDAGYACCPTHSQRLIACRNGNGYRCPAPKLGEPLCLWWQGEGYTPPAVGGTDDLGDLDSDTLRRRLRAAIAERDQWKERAKQLELQLGQVKTHNRFVTQAHGAEGIHVPSMRLTFIELKKELDRVPIEEREPDQFVQVRPAYMAACSNQNRSNISNHLAAFQEAGLIEKRVERTRDPETGDWCSATFVRPLVDLSDPSKVVIAPKPRGKQACKKCGSERLVREVRVICADCRVEQSFEQGWVNPPASESQNAIQENEPLQEAVTITEQLGAPELQNENQTDPQPTTPASTAGGQCTPHHTTTDSSSSSITLQGANQTTSTDNRDDHDVRSDDHRDDQQPPPAHRPPPLLIDDPYALPAVRNGTMQPDDPWILLQLDLQRAARG